MRRTEVHCTCGLISPYSRRDCVKSLRSSYTGLHPPKRAPFKCLSTRDWSNSSRYSLRENEVTHSARRRRLDDTAVSRWRSGVPHLQENATPEDPTISLCLGSWGGRRGMGVFLWTRYRCRCKKKWKREGSSDTAPLIQQ